MKWSEVDPVIFLDIDGVLNSFGGFDRWGDDEEHWIAPSIGGGQKYLITCSPRMGEAINSLGCDIWWVTTWQTEAYLVGDIIGVKGEVLDLDAAPGWKRTAVENFLGKTPRPFLWFEDDDSSYGSFNRKGFANFPPHRLFNTNPYLGITPEIISQSQGFLDRLRAGEFDGEWGGQGADAGGGTVQPMPQPDSL